jgi:hypothetical protein
VKAAPVLAGAAFVLAEPMSASAVVAHDGGVRLICAGWLPHDDGSDVNGTAVYRRASPTIVMRIVLWLIGSLQVCSRTAPTPGHQSAKYWMPATYCMVASDQHQPASSRAIATLATSGFLPRSVKRRHRWLRRRLPACPRARRAGSTLAQRARIVGPEVL